MNEATIKLKSLVESYILRHVELSLGASASSAGIGDHQLLIAEVTVDYCVRTSTLGVLFDQVYETYKRTQHQLFYFDALSLTILNNKITCLPWWVLKDFLDVFARNQRVAALERYIAF